MFVTFEGGEGVGKSTQLLLLKEHLLQRGMDPVVTREPGGTPFGEKVRTLFLHEDLDAYQELLLVVAMRRDHIKKIIAPALCAQRFVLCDRYIDSTLAYQGMQIDPVEIVRLHEQMQVALWPDVTFILYDDDNPLVGLSRKSAQESNRFEKKSLAFHQKVHENYRRIAKDYPQRCVMMPISSGPVGTAQRIIDILEDRNAFEMSL